MKYNTRICGSTINLSAKDVMSRTLLLCIHSEAKYKAQYEAVIAKRQQKIAVLIYDQIFYNFKSANIIL